MEQHNNIIKSNQNNNENTNALLIHLSSFAGYFFPLGSIIAPLILWQLFKNDSPFLDKHGKEALNFNLSFGLYLIIIIVLFCLLLFGFFFGNFFDVYNDSNFNDPTFDFETDFAYQSISSIIGLIITAFLFCLLSISKIILIIIATIKANNAENYHYPLTIKFIK
ncbi:DUF4870 domain-containing protein [Tenacibaculum piscium]|uniref:DUF4870 domain-containing protein n=1 Tax=Tenacibaculum piscium TaxID=1458515 RepID=UPI001EFB2A2D|nr:DUF4870 domain-containing protein [Tenacibaculum piscium]MCG8182692.1 DUF4870 domain-containing protein [Tenacibaculum piscium]MCG8204084.1 DUF4870 domain-containing protein [Tenacibaculum piscium]